MKMKTLSVLTGLNAALILTNTTDASYQGLATVLHTTVTPTAIVGPSSVWRVYALFSDPGDYLTSVAGTPTLGNMVIESRNSLNTGPGGNFINFAGGNTAPYQSVINNSLPNAQWDTFCTIGLAAVPIGETDATHLSPQFPVFLQGNSLNSNNLGWVTTGPVPQGMAGNGIANLGGTGNWGVLLMQLTVNAGNRVRGTVSIGGVNNNPLAGGTTFLTLSNQVFGDEIPAPGALAVFGLGLLRCSRRRR